MMQTKIEAVAAVYSQRNAEDDASEASTRAHTIRVLANEAASKVSELKSLFTGSQALAGYAVCAEWETLDVFLNLIVDKAWEAEERCEQIARWGVPPIEFPSA